jgi:hypothetical protein
MAAFGYVDAVNESCNAVSTEPGTGTETVI